MGSEIFMLIILYLSSSVQLHVAAATPSAAALEVAAHPGIQPQFPSKRIRRCPIMAPIALAGRPSMGLNNMVLSAPAHRGTASSPKGTKVKVLVLMRKRRHCHTGNILQSMSAIL